MNIVEAGLADKCEIQLSYAIGVAHPTSIMVDTFGTGKVSNEKLVEIIRENFALRRLPNRVRAFRADRGGGGHRRERECLQARCILRVNGMYRPRAQPDNDSARILRGISACQRQKRRPSPEREAVRLHGGHQRSTDRRAGGNWRRCDPKYFGHGRGYHCNQ